MSFQKIIEATWTDNEIAVLRHEALLGELDLVDRIREARDGYREAMESTGITMYTYGEPGYGKSFIVPDIIDWEDLYVEWEDGEDYAHDEDDPDA